MGDVLRVARREMGAFFASPVAYLFLGAFLGVSLFVFFWVETFFSRNIADVRPLYQWMPVLLIFLVAALTMRMWSEERRAGTLEVLLTLPVPVVRLVLGKFLACLGLVGVALALTVPVPVTVSLLGPLDWGPVAGAYLASLFLAAAYIAIGLFVSARSDTQIVSLIGTVLVCAAFYLVGSDALTALVGHRTGEILALLGSGSRFESITRGVVDLRDFYYYLSLVGVFLTLNVYSLERLRWARESARADRHRRVRVVAGLVVANLLAANLWLARVDQARTDITAEGLYSISEATRGHLAQLREPLLLRGYFSAETHPLLSPLVPRLRDLLREYRVAGGPRVQVEFIDPLEDPELEREAGERYGIRPEAFQTASKYHSAVVNSYFNVLVQYGDQYEVLGYRDLIEAKVRGEGELEVGLRNPEYDITRSIKKVLYAYQAGGDPFAGLTRPVTLRGFISPAERLPEVLAALRLELEALLEEFQAQAGEKLIVDIHDPDAGDGALAAEIQERYGFRPMATSLLSPDTFYFYMVLEHGDQMVPVALPPELDRAGLERGIQSALKRFAPGLLRTVALHTPSPRGGPFAAPGESYTLLEQQLQESTVVRVTDLGAGQVPGEADLLLVVSPAGLDEKQLFAVDQFLMQGGTVVLAASPYHIDLGRGAVTARPRPTGLEEWLATHGIGLEEALVLDPRNTPLPVPVTRDVGGYLVQEIHNVDYPYFVDVGPGGLERESGITAGLEQVSLTWASPITVAPETDTGRRVIRLLRSSEAAWTSGSADIEPDFQAHGALGFPRGEEQGSRLLAVVVEGRFDSHFAGRPSPLLDGSGPEAAPGAEAAEPETPTLIAGVIERSPPSARLVLIGSGSFLADAVLDLAASATGTRYLTPLRLVENLVDWSLEDRALLPIRGRSHYSRLLTPVDREVQMLWEYLNYLLALAGLGVVYLLSRRTRARREARYRAMLAATGEPAP